ncbi:nucleotidyltransferase family protein [Hymenobacter siberiensis]|jgi:predicted nucleotidyltransferase|uniref:nucleotidyltransferase family protein n=1 Tax=Hymenobacter siberiensis TaxID=2848396 RepID=UPI001C1DF317|nr:nucleotidyltransferase domain-containing protein [Hymenobacter siberiensis]MBU6123215.1 nucleotidyltransferase domain-containing protein [Hymenobacter siberiensis]
MLHLRPKDLALVHDLIARHLPAEVAVWAYGSRVNGNHHEGSDLDLVLRTPDLTPLPGRLLAGFREALTESNLPIFVDTHDWATLPESFHPRILNRYEVVRPCAPVPAVTA